VSPPDEFTHDLMVLTADKAQQAAVEALLRHRARDLGLPALCFEVFRHPGYDCGVHVRAFEFLRPYLHTHRYALVIVDASWEGAPPATRIGERIATGLQRNGWAGRSAVVVIDPETEAWCWVENAPAVASVLGVPWGELRRIGAETGHWQDGAPKPARPKELFEAVLRRSGTKPSSRLFADLAKSVPFSPCVDPAFALLRQTLQRWFGRNP
jgi:hypothetical protein